MSNEEGVVNKIVLWHPESDCYMYCHSPDERDVILEDGGGAISDVSDQQDHIDRAALQLGPWQIDANEKQDTELVVQGGTIETTEGTLIITSDLNVEIPAHIYEAHKVEIDGLEGEAGGPGNINPLTGV